MKNLITFSLWGNDPKYKNGVLQNILLAQKLYPEWVCRFYVDHRIDLSTIDLIEENGAEAYAQPHRDDWFGLFWRFYPISDPNVGYMISRDLDSRLNEREVAAVNEWIESGLPFHIMRDHKQHDIQILGGMFGCKGGLVDNIESLILQWTSGKKIKLGDDQFFLRDVIWPRVKDSHIAHDNRKTFTKQESPFPVHKATTEPFVGAREQDKK